MVRHFGCDQAKCGHAAHIIDLSSLFGVIADAT